MTHRRLLPPAFALLVALAFIVGFATIVEQAFGPAVARRYIYGSPWFWCLWAAMAGLGLRTMLRRRLWRRPGTFLVHVSLLVVLCGALLTALTSRQGYLHLRQGVPTSHYVDDGGVTRSLPFMVRLDSFAVAHYPGTEAPRDYVSRVLLDGTERVISMNHIACQDGYRLYQSSYDPDLQGSVLSVNYDPWGTPVTYGGYLLLGLSMMGSLLPSRRCRRVAGLALLAVLWASQARGAGEAPLPVVPQEQLREMEARQVMWNDRVAPMATMAQEFLLKVYGRRTYHGLTPMQVVTSWAAQPREWAAQPIIKRASGGGYACLNDFVDYSTMPPRLKGLGEDARTDERVALVFMLMQGTLVKPLPEDVRPLPETRVRAELLYGRVDWTLWAMAVCFVLVVLGAVRAYTPIGRLRPCVAHGLRAVCVGGTLGVCVLLAVSFALRWYISGRVPLTDSYETMLFVALCVLVLHVSVASLRREPGALLPAAFVLLVAHLSEADPHITPLVPVLHSPWLSAHVSVIMLSYAMLALSIVDRRLLKPAVFLLAAGIFLGAVWANVSWGSYWSWDPKESWALVTMLVYSLPLHTESLPWLRSLRAYRIYSIVALCCLAMTYWGVNHLLGGMHSYN